MEHATGFGRRRRFRVYALCYLIWFRLRANRGTKLHKTLPTRSSPSLFLRVVQIMQRLTPVNVNEFLYYRVFSLSRRKPRLGLNNVG